ncbi:MAG: protoheme IX farnesyltransferase [Fervidicoccaceae archaeon]
MGSLQKWGRSLNLSAVFLDLFKPTQTAFLVLSGIIAYIMSSGGNIDLAILAILTISLYFTIAGTTGFNMYLDRDIDGIMKRTSKRALPSGKLKEKEALAFSSACLLIGFGASALINFAVLLAGLLGTFIDLVAYTYLLKRRTSLSVVVGSLAGGSPSLGGWLAHPGSPLSGGIVLMMIISMWSLNHIWYISSYYSEDYIRAKVPMFPIIVGREKTGAISIAVTLMMIALIALLWTSKIVKLWTVALVSAIALYLIALQLKYIRSSEKELAKKIFRGFTMFLGTTLILFALSTFI